MTMIRLALLVIALAACGGSSTKQSASVAEQPTAKNTLYDRIGGMDAIKSIVDDFVAYVQADERIKRFFATSDTAALEEKLVEQFCEAAGGPCKYTGRPMKEAHTSMGVTDADFTALVDNLQKALDKHGVPPPEQKELLALVGAMKNQIVEK